MSSISNLIITNNITNTVIWKQSRFGLRRLALLGQDRKSLHCSTVCGRRRGPVSDVALPELVIDKPPNYYLSIYQKLNKINYFDTTVNKVNIGYEQDSKWVQSFFNTSSLIKKNFHFVDVDDDLLGDLESNQYTAKLSEEHYQLLRNQCRFTQEYLNTTVSLAHHYAIFRDLFYQNPVQLQTEDKLIAAYARNEVQNDVSSQEPTFSFLPIVPIDVKFHLENDDYVHCMQVFRGNLIDPEYGANPPSVMLNTAGINGHCELNDLVTSSEDSSVMISSGNTADTDFYTLALVNLDSHFADSGVCHWMLCNIHQTAESSQTSFETAIKYLPVYGIRGLGYHRFAFLLFKHNKPLKDLETIDDFDLAKRKFNGFQFIQHFTSKDVELELKPVGLSWFQTTWNESCIKVFYDYLDMRIPTYEFINPKQTSEFKQLQYPGRAPFNLYLDNFRDPKELSKSVLLERLASINPLESYDTEKMYPRWEGNAKLPYIHPIPKGTPDWYKSTILKKRAQIGRFRGLRPVSAILPHNNNADLDKPNWPRISADVLPLNCPNPYPDGKKRPKALKNTPWTKPLLEHHSLRIDFAENLPAQDKELLEKSTSQSSNS